MLIAQTPIHNPCFRFYTSLERELRVLHCGFSLHRFLRCPCSVRLQTSGDNHACVCSGYINVPTTAFIFDLVGWMHCSLHHVLPGQMLVFSFMLTVLSRRSPIFIGIVFFTMLHIVFLKACYFLSCINSYCKIWLYMSCSPSSKQPPHWSLLSHLLLLSCLDFSWYTHRGVHPHSGLPRFAVFGVRGWGWGGMESWSKDRRLPHWGKGTAGFPQASFFWKGRCFVAVLWPASLLADGV